MISDAQLPLIHIAFERPQICSNKNELGKARVPGLDPAGSRLRPIGVG